jgi:hypothetical protein
VYDYESDSDLDEDDDTDAVLAADRRMIRRNTVPTEGEPLLSLLSNLVDTDVEASLIVRQRSESGTILPVGDRERTGRTIHVKDMSYRTFVFLYTYLVRY